MPSVIVYHHRQSHFHSVTSKKLPGARFTYTKKWTWTRSNGGVQNETTGKDMQNVWPIDFVACSGSRREMCAWYIMHFNNFDMKHTLHLKNKKKIRNRVRFFYVILLPLLLLFCLLFCFLQSNVHAQCTTRGRSRVCLMRNWQLRAHSIV